MIGLARDAPRPPVERIGAATLYLARWQDVINEVARPAAVVSDPPYGQRANTNVSGKGSTPTRRTPGAHGRLQGGALSNCQVWPAIEGDDAPFDPAPLLDLAPIVALWGAHKFADRLPSGSMLVWDKLPTGKIKDQGCGEAAWINAPGRPLRIFRHLWDGLSIAGGYETRVERIGASAAKRQHPTQKPVDLMRWTIAQARVPAGGLILDPFMGAGSTGIAAVLGGHQFVGVECEERYFDSACRRIEAAQRKMALNFPPPQPAICQETTP